MSSYTQTQANKNKMSSYVNVVKPMAYSDFQAKKVFLSPKLYKYGTKAQKSFLSMDKKPIGFKTEKIYLPFGVSAYEDDWNKPRMSVSFPRDDETTKHLQQEFTELRNMIAEQIMKDENWQKAMKLTNRSKALKSKDVLLEKVGELLKASKKDENEEYPLSLNLSLKLDRAKCSYHDEAKTLVKDRVYRLDKFCNDQGETFEPTEENLKKYLPKGTQAKVIFSVEFLWFASEKCGLALKVDSVKFFVKKTTQMGSFSDDEDEETVPELTSASQEEEKKEEVEFDEDA